MKEKDLVEGFIRIDRNWFFISKIKNQAFQWNYRQRQGLICAPSCAVDIAIYSKIINPKDGDIWVAQSKRIPLDAIRPEFKKIQNAWKHRMFPRKKRG